VTTPDSAPYGITLGPGGAMWFTENGVGQVGRIDPTGTITEYPLPSTLPNPTGITVGPDGNLWLTTNNSQVGRITTAGVATAFATPSSSNWITSGPGGLLWYSTISFGSPKVGSLTTAGAATEFPLGSLLQAYGVVTGPDGNLWVNMQHAVGQVSPSGSLLASYTIPSGSGGGGIASGSDGDLWFVDQQGNAIQNITTSGTMTSYPIPTASSDPYDIVTAPDGTLWFTELQANKIAQITTSGAIAEYSIPTHDSLPRHLSVASDGSSWFAESATNKIGRLVPGAAPAGCTVSPTTLCLNNNRFKVTAAWQRSDGSSGNGNGVGLTPDSGYFWFFDSANTELVVKVLNGCGLNGHYWVFAAGLTNVGVDLTVTDTQTGTSKPHTNPVDTAFAPIQDTSALATCP